jgi:pyruvate kinase
VSRSDIPARRTKIVATIGPASDDPATLVAMADAGMNVARIPLAHGTTEEALARIERVRAVLPDIGILADLPGPKIRAAPFPPEGAVLVPKSDVTLVAVPPATASTADRIGVADAALVARLEPGDRVAIGDGGIALDVRARTADGVVAEVRSGGTVLGRPGIRSSTTASSGRARPLRISSA